MNISFNGKIVKPPVVSSKDWLLRHSGHKKLNTCAKDEIGNGPDMRICYCADCREILVMGIIGKGDTNARNL